MEFNFDVHNGTPVLKPADELVRFQLLPAL